MTVVHEGKVTWPPPPIETTPVSTATTPTAANGPKVVVADQSTSNSLVGLVITALLILGVGSVAPPAFMAHFTVFVLSIFIGWQVIWNVTPALHTPLMSVTNAISGIIVVGALLQIDSTSSLVVILAAVSVLVASINIAGGFLVTQKMLAMFRKEH
jgi:NAD(P) transhydrogenase subunit alpha